MKGLVLMLFYVCYAVTLVLGVGIGPAGANHTVALIAFACPTNLRGYGR